MVAEGGTKPLREGLRPIRGTTRVIVFALDGVGHDDLHRAIRDGRMRRTAELLGTPTAEPGMYEHAYSAPDIVSILPSTTIAAWTSIFTGAPPAETGITGNEWWARNEGVFYAPAPVSLTSRAQAVRMYTDGLVGDIADAPTLFEQLDLRSHVSMLQLHRGADLLQLPELANLGDLFTETVEDVVLGKRHDPGTFRETDESSVASVLSDLEKNGIPDLQVVYLGGVDLVTHYAADPLDAQQRYLGEVIDPLVGKVLDAYQEGGALADTYVLFISDHGHTPVLGDDAHALGMEGDDEPPALLEQVGFRVRPFALTADEQDFQAVVAYQGAIAYIYLADRSTCALAGESCKWDRPPRLAEDVLPVARAFFEANRSGEGLRALRGTLDLVLARMPTKPGGTAAFQVFDGAKLVPVAEYLAANPRPDLVRLEERIRQLTEGPHGSRAGDVLLLAKSGMGRPIEDRFYFGEEGYTSWHGSASAQDSRVPLVLAHPGRDGKVLRAAVGGALGKNRSHLGITPLVRQLLLQAR